MPAIRRVLVAVKDPGARSSPVIAKAAQLAAALNAQLHLFHGVADSLDLDALDTGAPSLEQQIQRELRREKLDCLERIALRLRRHGLKVTTGVEWDHPVHEAVLREGLRIGAGLIVAQSHGPKHRAASLLSYTDWELLRHSPVPYLLVKSTRLYRHPRVLAALDPTHAFAKPAELDAAILELADRLTAGFGGQLQAMHAYQLPAPLRVAFATGPVIALLSAHDDVGALARRTLEKTVRRYEISPRFRHVVPGLPAEAIPAVARRVGAQIVVMGALSRSGLKRLFIGNTAEQVIDRLNCDVLIVKAKGFKAKVGRARRARRVFSAAVSPP